ncbi:deoxyribonuclease-1-like [Asterias rubens]|uniref:deoxyribonuclease-1-like n=1 Tax=Asterias rubens TaxID=7604 RepID=UPI0014554182|nr:deoxyribonuclease-1-like [Asterias rubens]
MKTRQVPLGAVLCVVFIQQSLLLMVAPSTLTTVSAVTTNANADDDGSLMIGAFNIQALGLHKISKVEIVEVLVKTLRRYDMVLIQEIRDSSQTAIGRLLDAVNSGLSDKYEMVVSKRLGRTNSKEQYAYFYKSSKLTLITSYVYNDERGDVFEREPFIAYFESPTTAVDRFAMIGIHTKPQQSPEEISRLVEVYDDFVNRYTQKNVIIGGDLNAGCSYVNRGEFQDLLLRTDTRFNWITPDDLDTTVAISSCPYDRLVIAGDELNENIVPGRTGVFHFDEKYGLSHVEAKRVSDHYPVEMVIQGNLTPVSPLSHTTSGTVSCSGSFRAMVRLCLLVVQEETDPSVCIGRLVESLNGEGSGVTDRCTEDWIKRYLELS